jgi:hypothetical protein
MKDSRRTQAVIGLSDALFEVSDARAKFAEKCSVNPLRPQHAIARLHVGYSEFLDEF